MAEVQKNETAVRVDPMVYEIGKAMEIKAQTVASQCDFLMPTINRLAQIKQEYEGGPFAVYFRIVAKMPSELAEELPDPHADTGNNPGIYRFRTVNAKGKPSIAEHHFYKVLSDRLPGNVKKQQRIDMLELSMKDPVQYNVSSVPADIMDMPIEARKAEMGVLGAELSTSRTNVVAAFELMFHLRAVNSLPGVEANPVYAIDKDGTLRDGSDGREAIIDNTRTPIHIVTTDPKLKDRQTTRLSLTSFKKLRPALAKEKGGTYQALIDSAPEVKRGTKGDGKDQPGGSKPELINTKDTLFARLLDVHDYLDNIQTDSKQTDIAAIIQDLNRKGGSDDNLVTWIETRNMMNDILEKVFKANDRYIAIKAQQKNAA